ncbi:MAG: hypothetical protein WCC60_03085 [Ilumatobacteraceae bacterium]
MTTSQVLQRLTERLDRLEAENDQLRQALSRQCEVADADADDRAERLTSRRTWLARGAAVAVGAVTGAAMLPRPASAIGEMLIDQINDGSTTTELDAAVGVDVLSPVFYAVNLAGKGTGLSGFGANFGTIGITDKGVGVWGKSSGDASHAAVGVEGFIDNANSQGSSGVHGLATGVGQIGVKGESTSGWAGWFSSPFAELALGMPARPAPTTDTRYHSYGDVVAETGANKATLWFCTGSGTPGSWRRLAGPTTAGAVTLLPAPVRVYDSRAGTSPAVGSKTPLAADIDRVVDCTLNSSGVPADSTGVLINLTAVNQSGGGYLSVRAAGVAYTGTSNVNWNDADQVVANGATVACGAGATIQVRLGGATSSNVIVDVVGYLR